MSESKKSTGDISVEVVPEGQFSAAQLKAIEKLQQECFGDIPQKEKDEDFIAESFARVFTYENNKIVGILRLFKREVEFSGRRIVLGGMAGTCVTEKERRKGIATKMLKKGIRILKKENCEIACLNVDLKKEAYKVYERLGFRLMEREVSYENSRGEIKRDKGTMFMPITSQEAFDFVMNSKKTFHYGRGYW
jgi:predicted acetyltransferase